MNDPDSVAVVQQMNDDLAWALGRHNELEQQYPGESIVVWRKEVIAHGFNLEKLLEQAASAEHPREQLVVVEFPVVFESPR